MNAGGKVLCHSAVAIIEAHEGATHVEAEIDTETKHVKRMAVIVGYHGDFELADAETEVGRNNHSIHIVGKGECITCCETLEGKVALGE